MNNLDNNMKIGLVIMASGLGKRFGGNKLVADMNGKPLISWIIDATEGLFDRRVVVTRSAEVEALCKSRGIDCIKHNQPNRNDTVSLGLSSLANDVDYCFFVPGDQPLIKRQSVEKLILEAKSNCERIVRLGYGDVVGAPVGFPRALFNELLNLPEGKGGNYVVSKNTALVNIVKAEFEYELRDVDTTADLKELCDIKK